MSNLPIGQIITGPASRDAIHVAVAPVVAGESLLPCERVRFEDGKAIGTVEDAIGIVDPFLEVGTRVKRGQTFWLFLFPGTITALRHEWTHPAFEPVETPGNKAKSEAWLKEWIASADCPDYDTVMAAAIGANVEMVDPIYGGESYRLEDYGDGPRLFFSGRDAHSPIPPEFWDHVEIVTGVKIPNSKRAVGFSCSC